MNKTQEPKLGTPAGAPSGPETGKTAPQMPKPNRQWDSPAHGAVPPMHKPTEPAMPNRPQSGPAKTAKPGEKLGAQPQKR